MYPKYLDRSDFQKPFFLRIYLSVADHTFCAARTLPLCTNVYWSQVTQNAVANDTASEQIILT